MGYKEYMEARQKMNEGTAPAIQEPTQVAQPVAPASAPKTDPVGTYMEQLQKLRAERAEATNTPEPTRFFGKPNLANQVGGERIMLRILKIVLVGVKPCDLN